MRTRDRLLASFCTQNGGSGAGMVEVGEHLRRLRLQQGYSLSELAARSGVGKGTISELENGLRGARLKTLFALTDAMGAPSSALLPTSTPRSTGSVAGDAVEAVLLDRWESEQHLVETCRATVGQSMQQSAPHGAGVEETVVVLQGTVEVGPDAQRLGPGQSFRCAGDRAHGFRAVGSDAEVLILMHHPSPSAGTRIDAGAPPMAQDLPERSRAVQEHVGRAGISTPVQELPESTRTAAEAASASRCEVAAIASSLLFLADDEPLLVMTSGRRRADLDLLAAAAGVQRVRMATAKQVRETTGQAIGGVAPTGHPQPLRTLIDETLADHPQIWAAAGTPRTVMPLTFDQLVTLTDGVTARVAAD